MGTPKVIIINGERIFLTKIKNYSLYNYTLWYRTMVDSKPPSYLNFFQKLSYTPDYNKFWASKDFEFLYIKMYDGTEYYFYSDSFVKSVFEKTMDAIYSYDTNWYYKVVNNHSNESIPTHAIKAVETCGYMKRNNFTFTNDAVEEIIQRIDNAFQTI